MNLKKGEQPYGWKAFVEACPTCKNLGSNLCKKCKMEVESGYDPKPEFSMTNADRIRAMSDEELAGLFYDMCIGMEFCDSCPAVNNCPGESVGAWEEWLQQPAEE